MAGVRNAGGGHYRGLHLLSGGLCLDFTVADRYAVGHDVKREGKVLS